MDEIERLCSNELEKTGLLPARPTQIRIERFIEKRFNVRVAYDDLPEGVLGLTEFGAEGVEAIVIARSLDDEGTQPAERRIRTTMAHEGGHGLLHAHLFGFSETPALFGDDIDVAASRVLCRKDGIPAVARAASRTYDGRWWEFQANQAMGALLLPRRLVEMALDAHLVATGKLGARFLVEDRRPLAERLLADTFDVNPVVARIRLGVLYPDLEGNQLTL